MTTGGGSSFHEVLGTTVFGLVGLEIGIQLIQQIAEAAGKQGGCAGNSSEHYKLYNSTEFLDRGNQRESFRLKRNMHALGETPLYHNLIGIEYSNVDFLPNADDGKGHLNENHINTARDRYGIEADGILNNRECRLPMSPIRLKTLVTFKLKDDSKKNLERSHKMMKLYEYIQK